VAQLHELGHMVQNIYSVPFSPGARHTFGETDQDPQLDFAEGWATVFAAAVRNFIGEEDPSYFLDTLGTGATGPESVDLWISLENGRPYVTQTRGEANEGAIACALYDLIDTAATLDRTLGVDDDPFDGSVLFQGGLSGDELLWQALTSDLAPFQSPTIRDFFYGLFEDRNPGFEQQLIAIFDQWRIRFYEDVAEPNQTQATATPVNPDSGWSPTLTLYHTEPGTFAPGDGDLDFFSLELQAGATFSVETRYPGGYPDAGTYANTSLRLYRPDGSLFAIDGDSGVGRNALLADQVADQSGTWFVEVYSVDPVRQTGSYQLRVDLAAD
ncbi:MAG: PPC domain-containing protein, partial [Planctomycetota bacterium]